jgi:hypothetical protein
MGNQSVVGPIDVAKVNIEYVWYASNAALSEGEGVCYNWDYGTDTTAEASRLNRVETPSTTNAQWFAGVAATAYSARSSGQMIKIYTPGSVCNVLVGASTVVGVGFLTFDVTAATVGQFRRMGLPGRGSAQPLQTTTYVATAQTCLCKLMEGEESGGAEDITAVNGAITPMVGGTTCIIGASIGGNCTFTLADGTIPGLRKKYQIVDTELTTNNAVLTVSSGVTDDVDDVSLDSVTWAGASTCLNTLCSLYWDGAWIVQAKSEDVPVLAGS